MFLPFTGGNSRWSCEETMERAVRKASDQGPEAEARRSCVWRSQQCQSGGHGLSGECCRARLVDSAGVGSCVHVPPVSIADCFRVKKHRTCNVPQRRDYNKTSFTKFGSVVVPCTPTITVRWTLASESTRGKVATRQS